MDVVHIAWNITRRCNLNCIHCYLASGKSSFEELSSETAKNLIKSAYEIGAKSFLFTGGEPLLRSDLFDLIKFAANFDLKILIATNGTLLSEKFYEIAKSLNIGISVNLPSLDKNIYKTITGFDKLDVVLKNLEKLRKLNIQTSIGVVVMKLNLTKIEDVILFSKDNNFFCDILCLIPVGRADFSLLPEKKEYIRFLEYLAIKYNARSMAEINSSTFLSIYEPLYNVLVKEKNIYSPKKKLCSFGDTFHIDYDGKIKLCPFINISFGDVKKDDLVKLAKNLKINLPKIKKCENCKYNDICYGCFARAQFANFEYDPICFIN